MLIQLEQTTFNGTTLSTIVNVSSARLYLNGSIFNSVSTLVKNGSGNDYGTGGNTFNSTVSLINAGTGFFLLGNTNPDIFSEELTINNTGTSLIYIAYNSTGNLFNGNILLNSISGTGIRFGNNTGTSTLANTKNNHCWS